MLILKMRIIMLILVMRVKQFVQMTKFKRDGIKSQLEVWLIQATMCLFFFFFFLRYYDLNDGRVVFKELVVLLWLAHIM